MSASARGFPGRCSLIKVAIASDYWFIIVWIASGIPVKHNRAFFQTRLFKIAREAGYSYKGLLFRSYSLQLISENLSGAVKFPVFAGPKSNYADGARFVPGENARNIL
jgi:hypothetical protein